MATSRRHRPGGGPARDRPGHPPSRPRAGLLATTKDIRSGQVVWQGQGVINPYEEDGSLADLAKYPRLHAYLMARREAIAARHCALKQPDKWYRTIDRIVPSLTQRPKLLVPDIKGSAHVVYEPGQLYPHHNLYYLVSDTWDRQALQAVLLSDLTRMFISAYSTKMRGGYLRFQAQYLRRIRLPQWKDVRPVLQTELTAAAQAQDIAACNRVVAKLYRLSEVEQEALTESTD